MPALSQTRPRLTSTDTAIRYRNPCVRRKRPFGYNLMFTNNSAVSAKLSRFDMPIYEYLCDNCGFEKDALQKMSDPPLVDCPQCGKPTLRKLVSAAGFQLKGSGWYATDFRNSGAKPAAAKADGAKAEGAKSEGSATSSSGESGSGDSKAGESKSSDSKAADSSSTKSESSSTAAAKPSTPTTGTSG